MRLDDTAGCPGQWLPFRRSHAGICIQCDRYRRGGEQIEPAARVDAHGAFFCDERRYSGAVVPGPSVSAEPGAVRAAGYVEHAADCAPTCKVLQPLEVGPSGIGQEGAESAFRNAGVTPSVQGQVTKSEAREQQQLRAGFCHHEEGAS